MVNPVMPYAWGSRDGIATLQGRAPAAEPEAELWMGAHPRAASVLDGLDRPLDAVIAADPEGVLGGDVVARFGPRLPFMLKVLSAAEPLSLQVHPDDDLAQRGFAAEDAAGIDRAAPDRSYRDPYAKPEMLVALSKFETLLGFRPAEQAADVVARLNVRRLDHVVEALRSGAPTGEIFLDLVDWPDGQRHDLVAEVRRGAATSASRIAPWLVTLADRYPDDAGVAAAALLNHIELQPGQGIYVEPGQIHAHLHGTGVEILGGSDNVVRAGLTPKHVAIDELRRMLSIGAASPAVVEPKSEADGEQRWCAPRPEFALSRIRVEGQSQELAPRGPQILFCIEGKVDISTDSDATVTISSGESAFVAANAGRVAIACQGVILRATTGLAFARDEA